MAAGGGSWKSGTFVPRAGGSSGVLGKSFEAVGERSSMRGAALQVVRSRRTGKEYTIPGDVDRGRELAEIKRADVRLAARQVRDDQKMKAIREKYGRRR